MRMFLCQSHAGRDRLAGLIGQAVGVVFGVPSCLEKRVGGAKVMVKSRNQPAQLARKNALPVAVMRAVADAHKHLKQRKNRHISQ
jgi:class 3 adenylate cyclase